jgi:xanthine dehydrogenase accessory factor
MLEDVMAAANEALTRGETVALVTIVRAQGSTPQRVGAKMLVYADGRTVGTIGGGCYESEAFWKARDAIANGKPALMRFDLTDDIAGESGLICGGQMDVFVEPLAPSPHLYIAGGGHVSLQLARAAAEVGFRIHVLDDREKYANAERFPGADEIVVDSIPEWLERTPFAQPAYVAIVTRGHQHDLAALRAVATKDLRYVGLIGSRAKVTRIYDALRDEGLSADALRRVHAPIGLDLGAVTPAEIAVSIVAELVAVRHGKLDAEATADPEALTMKFTPPGLRR